MERIDTFDRLVCAVDGSPESAAAVEQVRALVSPLGSAEIVTVAEAPVGTLAPYGMGAGVIAERDRAERSLEAARALWPGVATRLLDGPIVPRLLEELTARNATLVAIGAGGHARASGILLGSVSTGLLHKAPCSVLVARPAPGGGLRSVVVGTDGSAGARLAIAAARDVARRLEAPLELVAALGGDPVDEGAVEEEGDVRRDERRPVEALLDAARSSDLLVVGSRGLRGIRALGSVGERVAHRASCSVLVVKHAA
jgi:nucleotide-binding universal stress UspA family protein